MASQKGGADRLLQLMVSHCVVPADDTPGAPRGEDEGGGGRRRTWW